MTQCMTYDMMLLCVKDELQKHTAATSSFTSAPV